MRFNLQTLTINKFKRLLTSRQRNAGSINFVLDALLSAKQVLTFFSALALVTLGVSPFPAYAAQSDLIVSVADPGIQFYADSGLTNDAPVLVETFENTQFGNWVCTEWSEDWWGPYCSNGNMENENTLYSTDDLLFESPVGVITRDGSGDVLWANQWGGAGGTGLFASAGNILVTISDASDYRYLGFWWSAGSVGNDVVLLDDQDNELARFTVDDPDSEEDLLGVTADAGYTHNPNTNVSGWQTGEKYAFVHLRYPPGFRKVRFEAGGNGFEFDNVTISTEVPDFSDSETTTETFNPYELATPAVLLADPRTGEVSFPGVSLGAGADETNAMLCISEVQDQSGSALTSARSIEFSEPAGALTAAGQTNLRTFSGSRADVVSSSSGLVLTPSNSTPTFGVVGSKYIRVTATPQTNAGTAGCTGNATDEEIIEIRFVNMLQRNSFGIQLD
jgi:hypothetical protein